MKRTPSLLAGATALALGALSPLLPVAPTAPASAASLPAPVTALVSRTSAGAVPTASAAHAGSQAPAVSADGRFVAFQSDAALVPELPHPTHTEIYRYDTATGSVLRVSVPVGGPTTPSDDHNWFPSISGDGRFVAWEADASNLVPNDDNQDEDVFVRDLATGTTRRASHAMDGGDGDQWSDDAHLSDDGQELAYASRSGNLVPGDTNGDYDVFVYRWATDTNARMSVDSKGHEIDAPSYSPAISGDGIVTAFVTSAPGVVPSDQNALKDVFVHPRFGTTEQVSVRSDGAGGTDTSLRPSLSSDGQKVAFDSYANNLVPSDGNVGPDVFVRDRTAHSTVRGSVGPGGAELSKGGIDGSISRDGTTVVFRSAGSFPSAVYRNPGTGAVVVSLPRPGLSGTIDASSPPAVSADGRFVAWSGEDGPAVKGDTNGLRDVFLRDTALDLAPFGSWEALIDRQFLDFEGRHATATEKASWKEHLVNGDTTIGRFIDGLAHGAHWAGRRAPIVRLYWAFFLRMPDLGGLHYWMDRSKAGTTLANIAAYFAASPEFVGKYGKLSDSAFVTQIYQGVFDRKPDAGGQAYWVDQLQHHGLTRGGLMVGFSESPEGKHLLAAAVDPELLDEAMLGRVPGAELKVVRAQLRSGALASSQVAEQIREGQEYVARLS